jgi:hypothetical protein
MKYPLTWLALVALLVLAGCDSTTPDSDDVPEGLRVQEIVLTNAAGDLVAHSHDDHWHGTIRARTGADTTLHAYVVIGAPYSGHDVPERDYWVSLEDHADHSLRLTSDDEQVARWSGDRHVLSLASAEEGAALTTVVVLRGTTTLYQSPPAPTIASAPATQ